MLKEVGQTALTFLFLNRADLLRNVEIGAMLRPVVVTDVVGQSVVEFSDAHGRVEGNRRHHLCADATCQCEQQRQKNVSDFHKKNV